MAEERVKWEEKHNHYIYNRCIGMVMAGDEYEFTPPNVYIKYEPVYEVIEPLITHAASLFNKSTKYGGYALGLNKDTTGVYNFVDSLKKYYGVVGDPKYPGTHPVYVKVSQDNYIDGVDEDYYMLYQWGRKDPMISRFEHIYDGNHCRITATDKQHLGEHSDIKTHKDWITYGIQHPDECMYNGGISSGTFFANLWDFSLGTDEINCMYPEDSNQADFYRGDAGLGGRCILYDFYIPSDRVFKSVYDPSPVGQKIPVGPVISLLSTNTNGFTVDAGEDGTWYYYQFAPYTGYGHNVSGMGGLFTECKKGADGNYIAEPDYSSPHTFWIPAFGYRFGNGITTQHGNEFVIWEGGAITKEGNGRVLFGNASQVQVFGKANMKPYSIYMSLPVLPIFDEPQWLPTF